MGRLHVLAVLGCLVVAAGAERAAEYGDDSAYNELDIVTSLHDDKARAASSAPADWRWTAVVDNGPARRQKRGVKKGDGHVIESFKLTPNKGLNVASTIVSDVSARGCAVYCVKTHCGAWSHRQDTKECRVGCIGKRCKYVAVPVTSPGSDYYEISLRSLGGLLFKLLTSGITSHTSSVSPSQIHVLQDPLAMENVLTEPETHGPVAATTEPPGESTPPPSPTPTVAAPHTDPTAAPPITDPPPLEFTYAFPVECGTRPTFGLRDNVRRLTLDQGEVRVVGGAEVASGTYPWQAQLEVVAENDRGFTHSCGGIVISPNLILTAAHCHIRNEGGYQIRVAQHNLKTPDPFERIFAVENTYKHSGYQPDVTQGQRNDVAMFKLLFQIGAPKQIMFNDYVQPICLPTVNTTLVVGQECHISGWGLVTNNARSGANILRGAIVSVLDPVICYEAYGNSFDEKLMICAGRPEGGVDTCQGDSGGPLSCRDETGEWFAAGIVSFGWKCGKAGSPGVYTRVSAFLEMIHRTAAFLNGESYT